MEGLDSTQTDAHRQRVYARYKTVQGGTGAGAGDLWSEHNLIPELPADRSARILDIGCGTGDLVAQLRGAGYTGVHGIDISEEQVRIAAERGIEGVELADLRDHLSANAGGYDVILAMDVLEHFDPGGLFEVLDLIAAALAPGGLLLARSPNAVSPFFGRYRYGDLTHGVAFTTRSLRQALRATGFEDIRFAAVDPVPRGLVRTVRYLLWQGIAGVFKFMLAVETGQLRGHVVTQNLFVAARR